VDEDVNIFDSNDVLWAMTVRYQGDTDTVFIPGVRGAALDPSRRPDGTTCKTIFDCTVPFQLKERFRRAEFMEVDLPSDVRL
jgi:4-hydroxy-3-polyprenylbenzoate decarboxylase